MTQLKELATGSCVTERVKRLAGNEIERGMGIPTIESRASNILTTHKYRESIVALFDK